MIRNESTAVIPVRTGGHSAVVLVASLAGTLPTAVAIAYPPVHA